MRRFLRISLLLAIGMAAVAAGTSAQQKTVLRIMPLGDSITFGSPDPSYGGYRHALGLLLSNDGYKAEFVGSRGDNEGHPGWTIAQLKNGLEEGGWLKTYRPDLILLHIGTNDLRQGGTAAAPRGLSALIDVILARAPQAGIIVAQIIPNRRGADADHRTYNAAIPGLAASKGPRVSVVDMQNILTRDDYADGLHPNASGYDKMAHAWESAIGGILSGSLARTAAMPATGAIQAAPAKSAPPPAAASVPAMPTAPPASLGAPPERVLRYVPGSTIKVQQLIGDDDKERRQPTLSRTAARYGIEGTDLGYSFEHQGRVYFLFGDTVGRLDRAFDTIGVTDAADPEAGVKLDFLTKGSDYLTIQPPGISMGAFEVPVTGISLDGRIYVAVSTNHSEDRMTDRSVLTRFTPPADFEPLRTISELPDGHFVKMSWHAEPGEIAGLPSGGPFVLVWGTGRYRKSDAYLAAVPASDFETGRNTRYFAGLNSGGGPLWSEKESEAKPLVTNGTLGDLSVTWCGDLGLWLMTYDSRPPATAGIEFSYSKTPWGPWSEPQVIFNAARDGAAGRFIHIPGRVPDDGLAGPVIGKGRLNPEAVHGGAYAPYMVERWTKVSDSGLDIYYVLSTWNPYVVVLMKSHFQFQ